MNPKVNALILFLIFLCLIGSSFAFEQGKAIIYDMPEEIYTKTFDKAIQSQLTPKEAAEISDFRFDGDTIKVLTVLVEWNNRSSHYSVETFDSIMLSRDIYPVGSIPDYFNEVSCGEVTVTGDVFGWYNAGTYDPGFWFGDLLNALDNQIDFSDYDGNNDGFVDAIIFLRAGTGMEDTGDPYDIWSYAVSYHPNYAPGPFDGVYVDHWCTAPEQMPLRNASNPHEFSGINVINPISVAAHELSHNLGLPDLYDYDSKLDTMTYITPDDDNDHPFVDWCLMGYNGYGIMAVKKQNPPHLSGWCKMEMGWNAPILLDDTEYVDLVINNIETTNSNSLYKIWIDSTVGEYYLLEYRNPQSTGRFDKLDSDFSVYLWPALTFGCDTLDRGLMITHVYDSLDQYSFSNDGTPTYDHYRAMVVDAGYNPDRDAWSNPEGFVTDSAQWWYPYETRKAAMFSDDVDGQSEFGPETVPGSDGYNGPSYIYIRVDSIVGDKLYAYVSHNPDSDNDGIVGEDDNCPDDFNPFQEDLDGDGIGDVCDPVNCGDVTGDYAVNIIDITALISYLYQSGPTPDVLEACDVNHDGATNILDITYLIEYLYQGGLAPICD